MKTAAERRRETAGMTKCACGNVAGLGETQCHRCRTRDEVAREEQEEARRQTFSEGLGWIFDFLRNSSTDFSPTPEEAERIYAAYVAGEDAWETAARIAEAREDT